MDPSIEASVHQPVSTVYLLSDRAHKATGGRRLARGLARSSLILALVHAACAAGAEPTALPPALEAARRGDVEALAALHASGANLGVRDAHERTALHWAAWAGQATALRWLLGQGLDVDARAQLDQQPLHLAAMAGQLDAVRALLDAGAAVDALNLYRMTPLHLTESPQVAAELLARGADLHARDTRRMTPLHYAVNKPLAKLLIDRGASVTAVDEGDATPEQMTGVARCQPGALRVFPRREALRLSGAQASLQIVVLSATLQPLPELRLLASARGVELEVEPAAIPALLPTGSTLFTLRARRLPGVQEGQLPLALRWLAGAQPVASCALHVDTRPGPTPEERGLIPVATLPIRQRPGWPAYAALSLMPLCLLGLWWWLARRRRS